MDTSLIERSGTEAIAVLTLNRAAKLNSFSLDMRNALCEALESLRKSTDLRCLVITGTGRAFSTGQDLAEREAVVRGEPVDLGAALEEGFNRIAGLIAGFSCPVICAVNGVAAGAGANLALCADIVIAARSATFIQSFSNIGLIPDTGGTWLLPRLAGTGRAFGLAVLGDALSSEEAADIGLIWKVVDDADLLTVAMEIATRLSLKSAPALAMTKVALRAAETNSFHAQLDLERELQRRMGATAEYRDSVAAFLAKRNQSR